MAFHCPSKRPKRFLLFFCQRTLVYPLQSGGDDLWINERFDITDPDLPIDGGHPITHSLSHHVVSRARSKRSGVTGSSSIHTPTAS